MGIGIVGRRRKLLDAIAALRAGTDAQAPTPSSRCYRRRRLLPLQGRKPPADGGTTVMFCDLVESTGIAAKLNVRRSHPLRQS
jgi:hypothetical protein